MSTTSTTAENASVDGVQLRTIPLSRIVVPDGFNPRGEVVDDRELERLADSMRLHGCLQPIRVRATDTGEFALIAGERRYRAAVKACLMELPAVIRPAGSGDEDEEAALLIEAVLENDLRVDLDPVARAAGYQRMLDAGLTIKGVAERCSTTQARVREHLRILKLPERVRAQVAAGEVPVKAVTALVKLASIHPELAERAVAEVLAGPGLDDDIRHVWADLDRDAMEVALYDDGPIEGIYRVHQAHSIERFTLTENASKDLEELRGLAALARLGDAANVIRFGAAEVEQARALGALHGENWSQVIVGKDVAEQLAADYIARVLKAQRKEARGRQQTRELQAGRPGTDAAADGIACPEAEDSADVEAREEAERRAARERERQERADATPFNLEIGRAIYGSLSRVKVDERALQIVSSFDVTGQLGELAMRGARYGFPGWVTEGTTRGGQPKYSYVEDRAELTRRAGEYLQGAATAGEIVGRQIALVAMAVYADQAAIANSKRAWRHVKPSGPWAGMFDELLDALATDRLPDAALAVLSPRLEARKQARQQAAIRRRAREDALERLQAVADRIDTLTVDDLDALEQDADVAYERYDANRYAITRKIDERRHALAEACADDGAESEMHELGGALGADGTVYSDADPGL